jgi:hypothetical protein
MSFGKWIRLQWDRAAAWSCVAAGAAALITGWVGVSGTGLPAGQLPYIISGGVGGVFLLGLAAMLWLSADLRDEWVKLDRLEQKVDDVGVALRDQATTRASSGVVDVTVDLPTVSRRPRSAARRPAP